MKILLIALILIVSNCICNTTDYRIHSYGSIDGNGKQKMIRSLSFNTDFQKDYPELSQDTNIFYNELIFTNCKFKSLPPFLKHLKGIEAVTYENCDSSLSKHLLNLQYYNHLETIYIYNCDIVKLPSINENLDNLKNIIIHNCDTIYISSEFINKSKIKDFRISNCKYIMFENSVRFDTLDDFYLSPSNDAIGFENMDSIFINLRKAGKISIANPKLLNLFFAKNSKIRKLLIYGSHIKEIPEGFYSVQGLESLILRANSLKEYRFDLLDTNTFKFRTKADTFYFDNDELKGIEEIIPITMNDPFIDLSLNFIDSIRTFTDTSLNKYYTIVIDYNNRKIKQGKQISKDEIKFPELTAVENYNFTLPKGIFNLQFRGKLYLCGYNLSESEKQKIREHFKYAVVEFDTPYK